MNWGRNWRRRFGEVKMGIGGGEALSIPPTTPLRDGSHAPIQLGLCVIEI